MRSPPLSLAYLSLFLGLVPASSWAQHYRPKPKDPSKLQEIVPSTAAVNLAFRGNIAVETGVLVKQLGLKPNQVLDSAAVEKLAVRTTEFYRSLGYTLVRVAPQTTEGGFALLIDEGAVAGIYVIGLGWYETFALRNSVLPFSIYNQYRLEQELGAWAARKKKAVRYELEETGAGEPQPLSKLFDSATFLSSADSIRNKLHERARYNVYIYFGEEGQLKGSRYGFDYSSANGVEIEGEYATQPLFLDGDRLELNAFVGLDRRGTIDPAQSGTIFYANAGAGVKWFTPSLGKDWFRLFLDSQVYNRSDQRPDLPLDQYWDFQQFHSGNVQFEVGDYKFVRLSLGYSSHRIYAEDTVASDPVTVPDEFVPAISTRVDVNLLLDDPETNRLLNHTFRFEMMNDIRELDHYMHWSRLRYQKVFFGRQLDTILRTQGVLMRGDVEFFDELKFDKIGSHSSFDRNFYVQESFTQSAEVRWNLFKRSFQFGLFDDATVFGHRDPATGETSPEFANSVGPAMYMTLYDAFQVYFNYAFGMATEGSTSQDLNLGVKKVF